MRIVLETEKGMREILQGVFGIFKAFRNRYWRGRSIPSRLLFPVASRFRDLMRNDSADFARAGTGMSESAHPVPPVGFDRE